MVSQCSHLYGKREVVARSALLSVERRRLFKQKQRGGCPHEQLAEGPMSTEGHPVDLETGEVIEPEIEAEVP